MRPGRFVVVLSGIDPEDDIQTAKVYFRSRLYREFYYVEMTYRDGEFVAILPQPTDETPAVVYYLEALDSAYNTARTPEYEAEVQSRCRQEPAAAYFPGGDPGITVGATSAGASAFPPGFAAAGIVGTITAAGAAAGAGGGIGAGTAVAVGAAAAAGAGAGVAVLSSGGDETTTTAATVGGGPPTTVPVTTTIPMTSSSTTTPQAPTTTPEDPGSPTTTTAPPTTAPPTTTAGPPLDASCFTVAVVGACRVRVDASCVNLPIDRYEWTLDLTNRWDRIELLDGPRTLEHAWTPDECEQDETLRFRLKVRRGEASSTSHKDVFVPGGSTLAATRAAPTRVRLATSLAGPDSLRGRIFVNETLIRAVDSSAPVELSVRGRRGANTLTGMVDSASGQAGTWRFALDPVVPGSLRVVAGNVVAVEPNAVVFRVSGHVGERLELTFVPRE